MSYSNMNKQYTVALIVIALLAIGGYFFPRVANLVGAVSPSGTTNSTMPIASINLALSTLAGTSTSQLNTDTFDRVITSTDITCTSNVNVLGNNGGIASWTLQSATTSVANQGLQGNTNYIQNVSVSTSTPVVYNSTSTEGVITGTNRIWPSGTYLTSNFNATSSAACTEVAVYRRL